MNINHKHDQQHGDIERGGVLVGSCGKKIIIILHDGHHFTWTKVIMVIINNYKINQLDLDWRDGEGRGAEEIARLSGSSRVVALIRFTFGMMVMVMVMVVMSNTLFRQRWTFQHPLCCHFQLKDLLS